MGKSLNGPDLTEVTNYIRSIGKHANCHVLVALDAVGGEHNSWLEITLTAAIPVLVGPAQYLYLQVNGTWPSVDHATFPGLLYNLCHQMDQAIGHRFEQLQIPWEL